MAPRVSIIIPVVDEAHSLGAAVNAVQAGGAAHEIIVVDGGSADDSASVARDAGAQLIQTARRQRAYQLNHGAQHSRGELLLFLHADTLLPPRALQSIVGALEDRRVVGGAFARRYASRSHFLQVTCLLAQCRNDTIGWHLGDQAMFARRAAFFQLGGFREVDRFEDLDFSRRLRTLGRTVTLRPAVTTSARRFERAGAASTTARDFLLTLRYLVRGLPASELQRLPEAPQRIGAATEWLS